MLKKFVNLNKKNLIIMYHRYVYIYFIFIISPSTNISHFERFFVQMQPQCDRDALNRGRIPQVPKML
jgi:hypothetical protein